MAILSMDWRSALYTKTRMTHIKGDGDRVEASRQGEENGGKLKDP